MGGVSVGPAELVPRQFAELDRMLSGAATLARTSHSSGRLVRKLRSLAEIETAGPTVHRHTDACRCLVGGA